MDGMMKKRGFFLFAGLFAALIFAAAAAEGEKTRPLAPQAAEAESLPVVPSAAAREGAREGTQKSPQKNSAGPSEEAGPSALSKAEDQEIKAAGSEEGGPPAPKTGKRRGKIRDSVRGKSRREALRRYEEKAGISPQPAAGDLRAAQKAAAPAAPPKAKKKGQKPPLAGAQGGKSQSGGGSGASDSRLSLSSKGGGPSPRIGRKTKVSFDRALPEDISNENFPDEIESFNFPSASVSDLAGAIGKLTGMNFIMPEAIKAKKITIIAPSKITVAEAYKAFLSALAINKMTVVRSGAFWKIMETENARKDNTEVYGGDYFPNTDQLITRVIKLKHIAGSEFSKSIKFLLSGRGAQSTVMESSNVIIISDYGSVIEKIMKILREIDTPGSEEGIALIPVKYASAEALAGILSDILFSSSPRGSSARGKGPKNYRFLESKKQQGNVKISKILPDSRTNTLVIAANKGGVQRIKRLVEKLDTYVDPISAGGIYVYNVLYGTAEEVYNTLMNIKPAKDASSKGAGGGRFRGGPRYSPSRFGKSKSNSPLFENVTIMADHNTNSLIISAKNKYDLERVKAMLGKIDKPRDQVFVQAVIAELAVGGSDAWETNLAAAIGEGLKKKLPNNVFFEFLKSGTSIAGFLNTKLSMSAIQQSSLGPGLILSLPVASLLDQDSNRGNVDPERYFDRLDKMEGLADDHPDRRDYRATLDALRRSGAGLDPQLSSALSLAQFPVLQILKNADNVNILSTPQLTTLDNHEAVIEIAENAPVGISSTNTNAGVSTSTLRQDVGLKMKITPRINPASKTIQMEIEQQFDSFSNKQSPAAALRDTAVHILKRNIQTKMVLNDGETAVMGGLIKEAQTENENKVPFLGDIPLLGWLFRGSTGQKEKRNLVVFITPRIISGKDQKSQSRRLFEEKLEERINFIKKYMKGRDPQGGFLKNLQSRSSFGPAAFGADPPAEPAGAAPPPDSEEEGDFLSDPEAEEVFSDDEEGAGEDGDYEGEGSYEGEELEWGEDGAAAEGAADAGGEDLEGEVFPEEEASPSENLESSGKGKKEENPAPGSASAFTEGFVPFGPLSEEDSPLEPEPKISADSPVSSEPEPVPSEGE